MTLADESRYSNIEYTFLKWPEFLEFIGRLAYCKFVKTPQHDGPLHYKLFTIIDPLLALIGERR